ncbi:MAG: hypothetical protein JZD41_03850 [Thermoproteus sp.]|nr:hypothetical protein [Thermoproteus sp.]
MLQAPGARVQGNWLYLWSSPYGIWKYKALAVDIYLHVPVYINSTCPLGLPSRLPAGPGSYTLELAVPPGLSGACNITLYSGAYSLSFVVFAKPLDWLPGALMRAVLEVNGTGWHYVELGTDGVLYDWFRPVASTPLAGCGVIYNGSLLIVKPVSYFAANPGYVNPLELPSRGLQRYGFFLYLRGPAKIYVYPVPCVNASSAPSPAGLANLSGLVVMSFGFPRYNQFAIERPELAPWYNFSNGLLAVSVYNLTAPSYSGFLYIASGPPAGVWAAVFAAQFSAMAVGTSYQAYFAVPGEEPAKAGGPYAVAGQDYWAWLYEANGTEYWVFSPYPPLDTSLGFLPTGWTAPVYVVAARGVWSPLSLVSAKLERLPSP